MSYVLAIGEYNSKNDTIKIEGVTYAGSFFRMFGQSEVGQCFRIVDKDGGVITVERKEAMQELWNAIFPLSKKK